MTVEQGVFGVAEAPAEAPAPPHRWTDTSPHPWRRYFARSLDLSLLAAPCVFLLFLIVGLVVAVTSPEAADRMSENLDESWTVFLAYVFMVPATIPVLALMIGLTGGSPGKWIFGIKVLTSEGRPLGFGRALARELDIWVRGYGLVVPLISLITLLMSHGRLTETGATLWDARQGNLIVHRPWGSKSQAVAIGVVGLMIAAAVAERALQYANR